MATAEKNMDEEAPVVDKKKKGVMKYVLIALAVMALVGISVGVSVYMTTSLSGGEDAAEQGKDGKKQGKKEKDATKVVKTPIYYQIEQPFVVNFQSANHMRFLQVTMELMTYDQTVVPSIEQAMPVIKNNLVFLLSSLTSEQLATPEGRLKVRADTLAEIKKILKERTGKDGVEDVYFTSFVMQ